LKHEENKNWLHRKAKKMVFPRSIAPTMEARQAYRASRGGMMIKR